MMKQMNDDDGEIDCMYVCTYGKENMVKMKCNFICKYICKCLGRLGRTSTTVPSLTTEEYDPFGRSFSTRTHGTTSCTASASSSASSVPLDTLSHTHTHRPTDHSVPTILTIFPLWQWFYFILVLLWFPFVLPIDSLPRHTIVVQMDAIIGNGRRRRFIQFKSKSKQN